MNEQERKADYERSAHEPLRWRMAAEQLFEAAAYLSKAHENAMKETAAKEAGTIPAGFFLDSQAHYFEGKCIELYLKCLFVAGGNKISNNGKLKDIILSHQLVKLSGKLKFQTSASEMETLEKLTNAVTFWGTYPIPTHSDKWRPKVEGIGGIQPLWFWTPVDTENYLNLLNRLRDQASSKGVTW